MRTRIFLKFNTLSIVTAILALMFISTYAQAAAPIELGWASFIPINLPEPADFKKGFIDRVNDQAKGELVIKYRGGPESIAQMELGAAVKKGVVDIAIVPAGFYEPLAHGVGAVAFSEFTSDEERARGAYDYLVELHKKGGFYYLGRVTPTPGNFFHLWLNVKVEKPEDFKGLKIGSPTLARHAIQAWGASHVPLRMGDYYQAMERHLVDGIGSCPIGTYVGSSCQEVTKYCVDNRFYRNNCLTIMNLDSWNKLPNHLQKLMIDCIVLSERDNSVWHEKSEKVLRPKAEAGGVQFYKLSPNVADWFIKTANDAGWAYQRKRFPDETAKLEVLMRK